MALTGLGAVAIARLLEDAAESARHHAPELVAIVREFDRLREPRGGGGAAQTTHSGGTSTTIGGDGGTGAITYQFVRYS